MNERPVSDPARRIRFERLVAELYAPLQRYVRRRADTNSVDDIVSDTLLTLWRRLDDIPPHAQLPWAYGVARRTIANHRRAAQRHLQLVRRAEAEPQPPSPSDEALDPELDAALAALPPLDREILRLWAWEQLEAAEIAVTLGLTANAASIRLHRAKKKLADNLATARKNGASAGHSHRAHERSGHE